MLDFIVGAIFGWTLGAITLSLLIMSKEEESE